jgi:hypothetical protein
MTGTTIVQEEAGVQKKHRGQSTISVWMQTGVGKKCGSRFAGKMDIKHGVVLSADA